MKFALQAMLSLSFEPSPSRKSSKCATKSSHGFPRDQAAIRESPTATGGTWRAIRSLCSRWGNQLTGPATNFSWHECSHKALLPCRVRERSAPQEVASGRERHLGLRHNAHRPSSNSRHRRSRRSPNPPSIPQGNTGTESEILIGKLLSAAGWKVVYYNQRRGYGFDLWAKKGDQAFVIEVKSALAAYSSVTLTALEYQLPITTA